MGLGELIQMIEQLRSGFGGVRRTSEMGGDNSKVRKEKICENMLR